MSMTTLTLPGLDAGAWQVRRRSDRAACALADRHYSRQSVGCGRVGGAARVLVLVTPCERAAWLTAVTDYPDDGLAAYRCTMFRNEGAGLSSTLITEAMAVTEQLWGPAPADGWVTWIDSRRVASSNPGYCFLAAGWHRDRTYEPDRRRRYLVRLRHAGLASVTPALYTEER